MNNEQWISLRDHVREVMECLGGYWPLVFNALRLIEECGELTEAIQSEQINKISLELADVFIVSTIMLDQSGMYSVDFLSSESELASVSPSYFILKLIQAVGEWSRLVNVTQGPKRVKHEENPVPFTTLYYAVCEQVFSLASLYQIDLHAAVRHKLEYVMRRDGAAAPANS